jgi:hypothetical protein
VKRTVAFVDAARTIARFRALMAALFAKGSYVWEEARAFSSESGSSIGLNLAGSPLGLAQFIGAWRESRFVPDRFATLPIRPKTERILVLTGEKSGRPE